MAVSYTSKARLAVRKIVNGKPEKVALSVGKINPEASVNRLATFVNALENLTDDTLGNITLTEDRELQNN